MLIWSTWVLPLTSLVWPDAARFNCCNKYPWSFFSRHIPNYQPPWLPSSNIKIRSWVLFGQKSLISEGVFPKSCTCVNCKWYHTLSLEWKWWIDSSLVTKKNSLLLRRIPFQFSTSFIEVWRQCRISHPQEFSFQYRLLCFSNKLPFHHLNRILFHLFLIFRLNIYIL